MNLRCLGETSTSWSSDNGLDALPDCVRVLGGNVSGVTGIRTNNVPVYRNHRLPAYMHSIVEQALVPRHRSHPIAYVRLSDG